MLIKSFHKVHNAGDALSPEIAKKYFSETVSLKANEPLTEHNLILIGSILQWVDRMSHVCGAGLLSPTAIPAIQPNSVNLVRGPLTRHFLEKHSIPCNGLYGDPGILAPQLFPDTKQSSTYKIGIIPHYIDKDTDWVRQQAGDDSILIIDITSPLNVFFENLQSCDVILSSSLHGVIFAHTYGKKALWIELSDNVLGNGFKFFDYYLSIGISPEQVIRHRINDTNNPHILAKKAGSGDCEALIDGVLEGIHLTKSKMGQASQ